MIGTAAMVSEFRERALSNSERELENTVLLLTRHFDQQFEDCEIISTNLIAQMQFSGMASPEIFKSRMSTLDAHLFAEIQGQRPVLYRRRQHLRFRRDADQFVGAMAGPAAGIAERAYFKSFKSDPHQRRSWPNRFAVFLPAAGPR